MGKLFIIDEINDSYTADVYADGCLKTGGEYNFVRIPSASGDGAALLPNGKYLIHSVIIANTGSGVLVLGDVVSDCATAIDAGISASSISVSAGSQPVSVLFDAVFSQGVAYRVVAKSQNGIFVTYRATV